MHDIGGYEETASGFPKVEPPFVCSVAEALKPGDKITINTRSRPIEVLGFEEELSGGVVSGSDYPYHLWWLRGNGTEYRLRWSHTCEYAPRLHTESELETVESYSVKHGDPRQTTIAKGGGERVRWISVVGVDDRNLSDWVLQRSIETAQQSK